MYNVDLQQQFDKIKQKILMVNRIILWKNTVI